MPSTVMTPAPDKSVKSPTKPVTADPDGLTKEDTACLSNSFADVPPSFKPPVAKGPKTLTKVTKSTTILEERKAEAKRHALTPTTSKSKSTTRKSDTFDTPSGNFALCTLYPLKSKAGTKKKWVELYCKGLKSVVCCFRGHHDAAIALNLDRKTIRKMCEKQGDDLPIFPTFFLLHASNKVQAPVYHYGIHEQDHSSEPEAYEARLRRFKRVHQQDRKKEDELLSFHGPKTVMPTNEVPLSCLNDRGNNKQKMNDGNRNDDNLMVTVVEDEQDLLSRDYQGVCIFCQDKKANIVFEPCRHSVLCEGCFTKGNCRKFCPVCRTTLQSTSKPEKIKLVRPRVFSAYAFAGDL